MSLEDIALIKPAIIANNGIISGNHYIDIRGLDTHQEKVIRAVEACKQRGELPPATIPNDGKTFFVIPDMSFMNFEFCNTLAATLLQSIHDVSLDV